MLRFILDILSCSLRFFFYIYFKIQITSGLKLYMGLLWSLILWSKISNGQPFKQLAYFKYLNVILFKGVLRINPKKYKEAFVPSPVSILSPLHILLNTYSVPLS